MKPAAFDTPAEAAKVVSFFEKSVLRVFGRPKGQKEQYLSLARVYCLLCKERRVETAEAVAYAESWMRGEMLPGMWEAAEAVANAMLQTSGDFRLIET